MIKFNFTKEEKRFDFVLTMFLFIIAFGLGVNYFNYYYVPDSDFFDFREKALSFLNFNLPEGFGRLPFYSILMGLFSLVMPGDFPVLSGAQLINLIAYVTSCVLIFRLASHFIGKYAFLVVYWFALDPLTIHMATQPRAGMLTIMLLVSGILLSYRLKASSYFIAFLVSITRYEGVFLIPAIFFKELLFDKRIKRALSLAALSSLGIATWILLTYRATGHLNPYHSYFITGRKPAGLDFVHELINTTLGFIGISLYHTGVFKYFIAILIAALIIMGFYSFFRINKEKSLPILIVFVGILLMKMRYYAVTPEQTFMLTWVVYLTVVGGLVWTCRVILKLYEERQHRSKLFCSKFSIRNFYVGGGVCLAFVIIIATSKYLKGNSIIFYAVTLGTIALFIQKEVVSSRWVSKIFALFLIVLVSLVCAKNLKAIETKLGRAKFTKAELRLTGEWYSQLEDRSGKIAATEPFVASYFAKKEDRNQFVALGSLTAMSKKEMIDELIDKGVTYVVWDSHHGKLNEGSFYYEKYNVGFIESLKHGKNTEYFRLVKTVKAGPSYAHIYQVKY